MGKVEDKTVRKYARVMHHIGGHAGNTPAADMIRGGDDELNLLDEAKLQDMSANGVDIERLVSLGALREATSEEVNKWEVSQGISEAAPDSTFFANFTTGNEALHPELGQVGGAVGASVTDDKTAGSANNKEEGTGGIPSGGSTSYKGLTKGELSEYNVPELKEMAKEENIEGYAAMLKPELLDALLGLGK